VKEKVRGTIYTFIVWKISVRVFEIRHVLFKLVYASKMTPITSRFSITVQSNPIHPNLFAHKHAK